MENYLVPACILLALTSLSFAIQTLRWRAKAVESERHTMGMAAQLAHLSQEQFDAGWQARGKQAVGALFRAALRAGADDLVLDALKVEGKHLLGAAFEEPIVQVPESV